jgi:hypothetical protein
VETEALEEMEVHPEQASPVEQLQLPELEVTVEQELRHTEEDWLVVFQEQHR